jgi:hypothetical protein
MPRGTKRGARHGRAEHVSRTAAAIRCCRGDLLLTATAAFAEAFGNPIAPALVLCLALLLPRPRWVRAAAAALGCAMAVPTLLPAATAAEAALALAGAVAALLLYAEVALHLVLPCFRFGWRCAVTAWELCRLVAGFLFRAGGGPAGGGPDAPGTANRRDDRGGRPLPLPPDELLPP